ncbi:MAG: 2-amino-4-hydroxy-6-hydroxymethyldihydropteridine diphosphokinase [Saprospiraceae bacterium]|nr:2-amino-4-hydroxy-6-hydroxymethyldihydropteridine diphosphokinase [Saprospiraceae bacterium]
MNNNSVFLSLGSNLGNRYDYLTRAVDLVSGELSTVLKQSSIYETEPWGNKMQNHFLNQIIELKSNLKPVEILHKILDIEKKLGRIRIEKYGPRTIDIDILFIGSMILNTPELILPHPRMAFRKFILLPLSEIAPKLIHPILKLRMDELFVRCTDLGHVTKFKTHEIQS